MIFVPMPGLFVAPKAGVVDVAPEPKRLPPVVVEPKPGVAPNPVVEVPPPPKSPPPVVPNPVFAVFAVVVPKPPLPNPEVAGAVVEDEPNSPVEAVVVAGVPKAVVVGLAPNALVPEPNPPVFVPKPVPPEAPNRPVAGVVVLAVEPKAPPEVPKPR